MDTFRRSKEGYLDPQPRITRWHTINASKDADAMTSWFRENIDQSTEADVSSIDKFG